MPAFQVVRQRWPVVPAYPHAASPTMHHAWLGVSFVGAMTCLVLSFIPQNPRHPRLPLRVPRRILHVPSGPVNLAHGLLELLDALQNARLIHGTRSSAQAVRTDGRRGAYRPCLDGIETGRRFGASSPVRRARAVRFVRPSARSGTYSKEPRLPAWRQWPFRIARNSWPHSYRIEPPPRVSGLMPVLLGLLALESLPRLFDLARRHAHRANVRRCADGAACSGNSVSMGDAHRTTSQTAWTGRLPPLPSLTLRILPISSI